MHAIETYAASRLAQSLSSKHVLKSYEKKKALNYDAIALIKFALIMMLVSRAALSVRC